DTRFQPPLCPDPLEREPGVVAGCIHAGGVVGLGGAVFPTYAKITADSHGPINTLIINAAECEPYITCDDMLMRERAEEIVDGMRILVHALKAKRAILGIEDNKQDALASITAVMERMQCDQVAVSTVPTLYPSGGERQLIKLVTGQEVPPNGLPLDIGIACFNVSTAAAVHRALRHSHPLTHRIVTVTGGGVERPGNYEVPIGTPISHLIEQAGGYKPDARRLIMGGPMMGFALPDDDLPIVKATNCLIVATEGETATPEPAQPCIRCGYCARDCPMNLLPQQLYWHTHARDFELVEKHHIFSCIECGICSYVCPSHIPLVDYFRFAKHEIRNERRKRDLADRARIRVEARTARLEREQAERDAKRAAKKKALNKKPPVKIPADKKAVDPQPPGDKQTMDKPAKVAKSED
ncbi:MAG: electron transport complex subunit RsxC, partial [Gammaproteobacteria bacterium]